MVIVLNITVMRRGTDEELQCSECKKSFRSNTLLDYHSKYFHRVAAPRRTAVPRRRTSMPSTLSSSNVERSPSGRFRSKNKSTCMCKQLYMLQSFYLVSKPWLMLMCLADISLMLRRMNE